MEQTVDQQIFELVKKSGNILVALPEHLTPDAIASGLALRLFLNKLEKNVTLASSGSLPENLKFLPGADTLQNQISAGQSLVVSLDTSAKPLEEISYQTTDSRAQIYLKSKNLPFGPEDISFILEKFRMDLIIILGAKSLAVLGSLYEQAADLFFESPKINIDNQPDNEYFGSVNLVEITATSAAEILAGLLQKFEQQLVDEDIATCLLTGIIANTRSFQHVQTTPKAFLKASELVNLGGRQQEIVKNIYQTKSLPLLKLWGRALARMKVLSGCQGAYSILNFADFEKAQAGEPEMLPTLKELADNMAGFEVLALIAEPLKNSPRLLVAIGRQLSVEKFLTQFPAATRLAGAAFDHYRVVEVLGDGNALENLENRFIEALSNLS